MMFSDEALAARRSLARAAEYRVERILAEHFGEEFVHPQRYHDEKSNYRLDYYVFSPSGNFGVEVMATSVKSSLTPRGVATLKSRQHAAFTEPLLIVPSIFGYEDFDEFFHSDNVLVCSVGRLPDVMTVMERWYTRREATDPATCG